jgi:hypothetical protein
MIAIAINVKNVTTHPEGIGGVNQELQSIEALFSTTFLCAPISK